MCGKGSFEFRVSSFKLRPTSHDLDFSTLLRLTLERKLTATFCSNSMGRNSRNDHPAHPRLKLETVLMRLLETALMRALCCGGTVGLGSTGNGGFLFPIVHEHFVVLMGDEQRL